MNDQIDNWLLSPVCQCVTYLSEEMVYSSLVRRGLKTMTGMTPFFTLANERFHKAGIDTVHLKALARDYCSWESKIQEHVDNDFSTVHRHSLVGLWCVVETTVEDSVLLILEKSHIAEKLLDKAGYRVKPSLLKSLNSRELHQVYSSLERQARDRGNIAEAWLDLLAALDVKFTLETATIDTIVEANEVRNCILHRGGIIDERAAAKAPGLQQHVGQRLEISEKRYVGYYNALGTFATAMIEGVTSSCHCQRRQISN
jgi:hypothetical protein